MTARGIALALAFLLLATGAAAVPGACCPSSGRAAEQAVDAVDCCATMLECPTAPEAALTSTVRGVETLLLHHALPADPALFEPGFLRLSAARPSPGTSGDGPPLYRLHAQLLI